jgi:hypothetical protein
MKILPQIFRWSLGKGEAAMCQVTRNTVGRRRISYLRTAKVKIELFVIKYSGTSSRPAEFRSFGFGYLQMDVHIAVNCREECSVVPIAVQFPETGGGGLMWRTSSDHESDQLKYCCLVKKDGAVAFNLAEERLKLWFRSEKYRWVWFRNLVYKGYR